MTRPSFLYDMNNAVLPPLTCWEKRGGGRSELSVFCKHSRLGSSRGSSTHGKWKSDDRIPLSLPFSLFLLTLPVSFLLFPFSVAAAAAPWDDIFALVSLFLQLGCLLKNVLLHRAVSLLLVTFARVVDVAGAAAVIRSEDRRLRLLWNHPACISAVNHGVTNYYKSRRDGILHVGLHFHIRVACFGVQMVKIPIQLLEAPGSERVWGFMEMTFVI